MALIGISIPRSAYAPRRRSIYTLSPAFFLNCQGILGSKLQDIIDLILANKKALTPISTAGSAFNSISVSQSLSSSSVTPNFFIILNKNSNGFVDNVKESAFKKLRPISTSSGIFSRTAIAASILAKVSCCCSTFLL